MTAERVTGATDDFCRVTPGAAEPALSDSVGFTASRRSRRFHSYYSPSAG